MHVFVYYSALVGELIFLICLTTYLLFLIYSHIKGAPYVPTKNRELKRFLKEAGLSKNKQFLELGCGDGRVTIMAAKEFGVKGIGVDVNPLLIYLARLKAKLQHVSHVEFRIEDIRNTDFSKADVIYLFLMPEFLYKLQPRFKKETKKGAVFISHGFKLWQWDKYMYKTIDSKPFPTYFYKLK